MTPTSFQALTTKYFINYTFFEKSIVFYVHMSSLGKTKAELLKLSRPLQPKSKSYLSTRKQEGIPGIRSRGQRALWLKDLGSGARRLILLLGVGALIFCQEVDDFNAYSQRNRESRDEIQHRLLQLAVLSRAS